jgi:hypothetical protein
MADPFRMFRDADTARQESLRMVWRELYDVLAGLDKPAEPVAVRCAVYRQHEIGTFRAAVGRLVADGPPACAECIERAATRPGGFPLKREVRK